MKASAPVTGSVVLDNLLATIGEDGVRLLIAQFGGTSLNVPERMGADHKIRRALGNEIAEKLVCYHAGSRIVVPNLRAHDLSRIAAARRLADDQPHLTTADIALKVGAHERSVYRWLKGLGDPAQLSFLE